MGPITRVQIYGQGFSNGQHWSMVIVHYFGGFEDDLRFRTDNLYEIHEPTHIYSRHYFALKCLQCQWCDFAIKCHVQI